MVRFMAMFKFLSGYSLLASEESGTEAYSIAFF